MAKKFYYDTMGITEATITAGTFSSDTFSPSSSAITNEHYINDQSIGQAVTGFNDEDTIRIDFGSNQTASDIILYNKGTTTEFNDLFIYNSDSATSSLSPIIGLGSMVSGWDADELGSTSSKRYWFLRSEDGDFDNLSEVILGVPLTFENEPDIGIATQEIFGTDLNTSLGGVEYANKRHEPKTTFQLNFSNISQTFKNNLVSFEQDVTNFKKFVYYDDSSYHYVRLDSPIKFTEVAFQRFSASLKLREQLS